MLRKEISDKHNGLAHYRKLEPGQGPLICQHGHRGV